MKLRQFVFVFSFSTFKVTFGTLTRRPAKKSKIINTRIANNYNTFLCLFAYYVYHKLNTILPTFTFLTLCHLKHVSKYKYSFLSWKSCTVNTTVLTFSIFSILTGCLFQSQVPGVVNRESWGWQANEITEY